MKINGKLIVLVILILVAFTYVLTQTDTGAKMKTIIKGDPPSEIVDGLMAEIVAAQEN